MKNYKKPSEVAEDEDEERRSSWKNKGEYKKKMNEQRRQFLLTFFDKEEGYEEKEVNGFWLVKSWNGNMGKWQIAIFTKISFKNYKKYRNNN